MELETYAGELISEACAQAAAMAQASGEDVTFDFNGTRVVAHPGDAARDLESRWRTDYKAAATAYRNSDEYKQRQREYEGKERRKKLMLEGALLAAPPAMSVADQQAWQKWQDNNTDPYGAAVVRYAELWARLMEGRISNGDTVEGCADEASHLADTEGITGFMYGAAVSVLATCWKYGEQLRRWHNLKTQLGHEGEKANESGGVLNPALLNIG